MTVAFVAFVVLAACGGKGNSPSPTVSDEPSSYGSEADTMETSPATAAGAPPVSTTLRPGAKVATAPTTSAVSSADRDLSPDAHRTIVERDGFRLHLGVGDRVRYAVGGPIELSIVVENISGEVRRYDTNDPATFVMTREGSDEVVWEEWRCRRGRTVDEPYTTPAIELPPGERVGFSGRFPWSEQYDGDRTGCNVPAGRYQVWGRFPWCPPASITDGHCRGRATIVRTLPVTVELVPAG